VVGGNATLEGSWPPRVTRKRHLRTTAGAGPLTLTAPWRIVPANNASWDSASAKRMEVVGAYSERGDLLTPA